MPRPAKTALGCALVRNASAGRKCQETPCFRGFLSRRNSRKSAPRRNEIGRRGPKDANSPGKPANSQPAFVTRAGAQGRVAAADGGQLGRRFLREQEPSGTLSRHASGMHELWLLLHEVRGILVAGGGRPERGTSATTRLRRTNMATLQVKGLDDQLYQALGARASMDNRSVSQEVAVIIREFLSRPAKDARQTTQALLELAGTWQDDRSARQIAADIRKARRSGRRFRKDRDVFA